MSDLEQAQAYLTELENRLEPSEQVDFLEPLRKLCIKWIPAGDETWTYYDGCWHTSDGRQLSELEMLAKENAAGVTVRREFDVGNSIVFEGKNAQS